VPRRLLLRFLLLPAIVLAGFAVLRFTPLAGYLSGDALAATVRRLQQAWWAPALLVAGYVVLCPVGVPASPLMVAGGIVFGAVYGTIYNLVGLLLGGLATYFLGRALGREFIAHLAGRRLKKVERALARRGFWGLVGVRFLPLPFALVNYCIALAGIRPALFLLTMALGLTPTTLIYTYFFALLPHAAAGERSGLYVRLAVAIGLLVLAILLPPLWQGRARRRKYREIVARRRARPPRSTLQ
jgi:phospholipase D1/2